MSAAEWLNETVRWGQVNFNEEDPRTLDVAWWVEYWQQCDLQGVTLNIGGPVAFHPTDVPFHRRSAFLDPGRDLFGETFEAARGIGLRVLGRLDPSFMNQQLFDEHPDWCITAADGTPATIASSTPNPEDLAETLPELAYYACFNSPHFSSYIPSIIREVMTRYDIDGIFTNAWPALGLTPPSLRSACYCRWCQAEWAKVAPETPLPVVVDVADPVWRTYVRFVQSRVEEVQRSLRALVTELDPEASFVSTAYPAASSGLRWDRWIDLIDALGSDGQGRRNPGQPGALPPALWEVGLNAEFLQAVSEGKPVIRFLSGYLFQLFRHASRPELEMRLQMAGSLAHGERPKWHVLGGVQHDRRWMAGVAEFDGWMRDVDPYLRDRRSAAELASLWSPRSVHLNQWTTDLQPDHGQAISGWYAALLEARIPVDVVHERVLGGLHEYKVVILPSGLCLDDEAIDAIERYREAGGRLILTCNALVNDEWGQARDPDPGQLLTGVSPTQSVIGPLEHSYLRLPTDKTFFDLGDTDTMAGGTWIMPLQTIAPFAALGAWIPDYVLHPTHASYMPTHRADVPGFVVGSDQSFIRIAMDLDAQYNRLAIRDHATIMVAAVSALLGGDRSIEVEGTGLLDVKLWKQATSLSAFLINLDTPALYGGFATQIRPLGPQLVRVRLDTPRAVERVTLQREGIEAEWSIHDDVISIEVPSINDFELVTIDLALPPIDVGPE